MLAVSGILLIGLAYLLLNYAYFVSRYRPKSFWGSETGVLVVLAPAAMILFAAGGACLAQFWLGGGLSHLSGVDVALSAAVLVLIVLYGHFSGKRLREARAISA